MIAYVLMDLVLKMAYVHLLAVTVKFGQIMHVFVPLDSLELAEHAKPVQVFLFLITLKHLVFAQILIKFLLLIN